MNKIILKGVRKTLKGVDILEDINLEFEKGKIYGLCGTNGSGKTMLLRMVAGLIRPTEGNIYIDDLELHKDLDFPESMGVLIENPNFWSNYTGREVLLSLAKIKNCIGSDEINEVLGRVGLKADDKRTVKKYSLGMKQRLGIAQAIMEEPEIILLDEPSNALDRKGAEMVRNIILEEKEKGNLVILTSHQMDDLAVCDEIYEIEEGKIVGEK